MNSQKLQTYIYIFWLLLNLKNESGGSPLPYFYLLM